jgi:DNA-binding transcriptional LysR family regulator
MLNWDDLRIFLALARNSRLNTAASAVGIDATTMSRRLARLATSIDATLFEQSGGRHVLTERGLALLESAERAEAAVLEAQQAGARGTSGVIRIAVAESLGTWFLGPRLRAFQDAHPEIMIDLISPSWYPDPLKREVDVAILTRRPARGPLTARKIVDFSLHLYASEEYLDKHPPVCTLEDLAGHRFVGYIREMMPHFDAIEYSNKIVPGLVLAIRTTSMSVQANLVVSGAGVGLLPYYVGIRYPGLKVVCPNEVDATQSFWLVVREDVRRNARVDAFVKWITAQVHENKSFFSPSQHTVAAGAHAAGADSGLD